MNEILLAEAEQLRLDIEACFNKVHPIQGNNSRCATGEDYVVYSISHPDKDFCRKFILNTFKGLSDKKYLYWRIYPEFEINPKNSSWRLYCRAVVSDNWKEEGQQL